MSKKEKLQEAIETCDKEDRSTAFMIEYMQDYANATYDEVLDFLKGQQ